MARAHNPGPADHLNRRAPEREDTSPIYYRANIVLMTSGYALKYKTHRGQQVAGVLVILAIAPAVLADIVIA